MKQRIVHLRPETVINLGRTKTRCGRTIVGIDPDTDLSAAVVTVHGSASRMDVTLHGTLATCQRCLRP